jgi:hypothetical protein
LRAENHVAGGYLRFNDVSTACRPRPRGPGSGARLVKAESGRVVYEIGAGTDRFEVAR